MNKLFAILPATALSVCVSLGVWAQAPASAAASTPVTPVVAASAAGVTPVEVKPAVVSTVGPAATPAATPAASGKSSPSTTVDASAAKAKHATAKQATTLQAKAGHKTVHSKAAKAGLVSGAVIK